MSNLNRKTKSSANNSSTDIVPFKLGSRYLASLIDGMILIVPSAILAIPVYFFVHWIFGIEVNEKDAVRQGGQLAFLLCAFLYHCFFEIRRGASIGVKSRNGIVKTQDGEPCSNENIIARNALLYLGPFGFGFVMGLGNSLGSHFLSWIGGVALFALIFIHPLIMLIRKDNRGLVDLLCGSMFVDASSLQVGEYATLNENEIMAAILEERGAVVGHRPLSAKSNAVTSNALTPRETVSPAFTQTNPINQGEGITSIKKFAGISEDRLNAIYAHVAKEVEDKKIDPGLMARAAANANGDLGVRDSLYLQFRVEAYVRAELAAQEKRRANELAASQEARRAAEREERIKAKERLLSSPDSAQRLEDFSKALQIVGSTKTYTHPITMTLFVWFVSPIALGLITFLFSWVLGPKSLESLAGIMSVVWIISCFAIPFSRLLKYSLRQRSS